jgi:heat shock protein HslJ
MIARTALAAVLLAFGLAACAGESGSSGDPTGTWTLTSGSGAAGDNPVTVEVEGSAASGQGPCNRYMGLTLSDGDVTGTAGSTQMACEEGVMAAETAYFAALEAVEGYEVDGDTLILTGPDVELTFERS